MSVLVLTPSQQYYQDNKKRLNKKRLENYHKNKHKPISDNLKAYRKKYRQDNKEKSKIYHKEYYKKTHNLPNVVIYKKKGRVADYHKEYYERNKQKIKDTAKINYNKRKERNKISITDKPIITT